jgi:hypothetical protein
LKISLLLHGLDFFTLFRGLNETFTTRIDTIERELEGQIRGLEEENNLLKTEIIRISSQQQDDQEQHEETIPPPPPSESVYERLWRETTETSWSDHAFPGTRAFSINRAEKKLKGLLREVNELSMMGEGSLMRECVRDSIVQRLAILRADRAGIERGKESDREKSKGVVGSVYSTVKWIVGM